MAREPVDKELGTLFVVATPLGNLEDLSPRAVKTLESVDLIACEDTRRSRKLFLHFGIDKPTTSYHEHNEEVRTPQLVSRLLKGQSIALISDAGTPLLSDPGYRLVKQCHLEGLKVIPIPGPFAGAAAASVSGLPTDRVLFVGFLPKRRNAQEQELREYKKIEASLVFYLPPHQLLRTLGTISGVLGNRRAYLTREMTKVFESGCQGRLDTLCSQVAAEEPKGEYTLVVEGLTPESELPPELDAEAYVEGLIQLRNLSLKDAVRQVATELGIPRRELYNKVAARKTRT